MEAHFVGCKHCQAVLDGTRNIVTRYGDNRAMEFELPAGFDQRLRRRLAQEVAAGKPRSGLVWMLAVAAGALFVGSYGLARAASPVQVQRSELAQPGIGVPAALLVQVDSDGKLYHVPGCDYLHVKPHENPRSMTAEEAIRAGYAPCVRCLRQYLLQSAIWKGEAGEDFEEGIWAGSGQPRL
jgi:hypothetical protein